LDLRVKTFWRTRQKGLPDNEADVLVMEADAHQVSSINETGDADMVFPSDIFDEDEFVDRIKRTGVEYGLLPLMAASLRTPLTPLAWFLQISKGIESAW
jgi:hypothetical protein